MLFDTLLDFEGFNLLRSFSEVADLMAFKYEAKAIPRLPRFPCEDMMRLKKERKIEYRLCPDFI